MLSRYSFIYMKKVQISDLKNKVGEIVSLGAWVHIRRDQGKMIFFDFRDRTGLVQAVVLPGSQAMDVAKTLRSEWVVSVTGQVNQRPEKMVNQNQENGSIEVEVHSIVILNEAETPVFDITSDTKEVNEEVRLKNRFLDLRSHRMSNNLKKRYLVQKFIRDYLDKEGFYEVETPLLTAPTPEGARDYLVPARLWPGNFYALPQSPQQYKQLLMSSGVEKYFQFARCLRDEDTRGDRQPEFTQLDMEMSFVEQEDVIALNEALLISLVEELYPEKVIQTKPFPRLTYKEAMEKYNSDRPDLRDDKNDPNLLAFVWVIDFPFFEKTANSDDPQAKGEWTFTHNPFSQPHLADLENLMSGNDLGSVLTTQYDIVLNGFEIGGGSIRAHKPEVLKRVFQILGHSDQDIESKFGHMLRALGSGTPPHGGIAWGFDRLMMILQNEPNIREVIPFAKTGEGKDLMMGAPTKVSDNQLSELSLLSIKPE